MCFFVFSVMSTKLCRGFFLAFLPGEGAITAGSSAGGGSARFFPLRSVVVVILVVSAMLHDIGGVRLKCEVTREEKWKLVLWLEAYRSERGDMTYCFLDGPVSIASASTWALFFPLPTAPAVLLLPWPEVEVAWSASGDASPEIRADRRVRGCVLFVGAAVLGPEVLVVGLARVLRV